MRCAGHTFALQLVAIWAQALFSTIADHSMKRASKLRRIDELRRSVPYVSASALSAILEEARRDMPEISSREAIRKARDIQVNEVTPYGTLIVTLRVELLDGAYDDMYVVNPFAQLWLAAKNCEGFARLLVLTLAVSPSSFGCPWRFIIYADEVVPGNQLSFHNMRKCWAIYFSFMEFGEITLSNEDAWFCTAAERTDRVKHFGGGIAQVFREILKYVFADGGHNLQTSGLTLDLFDGSVVRIWAKLGMILQDGGAHKQVFMVKGDGGTKPCFGCRNLYSRLSGIAGEDGEDMLTSSMHRMSDMDFATDDDVVGTVLRLADCAQNRPGELKLREQACGFNHSKFSIIYESSLRRVVRPVSVMAHDWMHTVVVHGVWNTIVLLCVITLQKNHQTRDVVTNLFEYLKLWTLPLRLNISGADLADAFAKTRWSSSVKAKYLKCTASHAISMFAIIGCFIQSVYVRSGTCVDSCLVYMALCGVMDMLMVLPRGNISVKQLDDAIDTLLRLGVAVGWEDYMHPKFHWLLHLILEYGNFGMLLTCWVHERKHRMVKRYTNNQRNTQTYEKSVLAEITCQHMHDLRPCLKFSLAIALQAPIRKCSASMMEMLRVYLDISDHAVVTTSKSARTTKFEVVHTGDIVTLQDENRHGIAKVQCLFAIDDEPLALIDQLPVSSNDKKQGSVEVPCTGTCKIVPASCILAACTYRQKPTGVLQVLIHCIYRDSIQ